MIDHSKHRVLLINPNGWDKASVNLGLCYLASALKAASHEAIILDVGKYDMTDEQVIKEAKEFSPTVIGVSVKTATAKAGGRLATVLKKLFPDAIYVAGGAHITVSANTFMKEWPVIDYALKGESEESLVGLLEGLANKTPIDKITGAVYRDGEQIKANCWAPPANLDILSLPNLDVIKNFSWEEFRYPMVTSRGCPFDCTYCCVNKLTGSRKWRYRSVNSVVDELEFVNKERGVRYFEIWDDNLTLHLPRAKQICKELIKRKLNLSWYCHTGIRADRIDTELSRLMRRAGCTSVAFGIESGNPETFDSIKKGEPMDAVVNAVKIVKAAGIEAIGYFIIGLPGDTLERFIQTVRFQRSLGLNYHLFHLMVPYPMTEAYDIIQDRGTMLLNITDTQHYHDDIVPISFEMPEFPRQDIIRAFYLAKFFPLYEAIERIDKSVKEPVVVYKSKRYFDSSLAKIILSCSIDTKHIVVGASEAAPILAQASFSQMPKETKISFNKKLTAQLVASATTFVCSIGDIFSRRILLSNSALLLFDRAGRQLIEVRKPISAPAWLPAAAAGAFATFVAIPNITKFYAKHCVFQAIKNMLNSHVPWSVPHLKKSLVVVRNLKLDFVRLFDSRNMTALMGTTGAKATKK